MNNAIHKISYRIYKKHATDSEVQEGDITLKSRYKHISPKLNRVNAFLWKWVLLNSDLWKKKKPVTYESLSVCHVLL